MSATNYYECHITMLEDPRVLRPGRPAERPYTARGIKRCPCVRCSRPAHATWQVCADERRHRPLCKECDIALNELVLRWAGDPEWQAKIAVYRAKVMGGEA